MASKKKDPNSRKHKSHKAAARRFKVTNGAEPKVLHRSQHTRHLQSNKSKRQQRALKQDNIVFGTMKKKILQMLGRA